MFFTSLQKTHPHCCSLAISLAGTSIRQILHATSAMVAADAVESIRLRLSWLAAREFWKEEATAEAHREHTVEDALLIRSTPIPDAAADAAPQYALKEDDDDRRRFTGRKP